MRQANAQNTGQACNLRKGPKTTEEFLNGEVASLKGQFTSSSLVKVFFKLDNTDWHGYDTKSVWAESLLGDRYRLSNTPFFARGINFKDVIFVKEQDGNLVYKSTCKSNSTFDLPDSFRQRFTQ